MASGRGVIWTGHGNAIKKDADYVKKKMERANRKIAEAMKKMHTYGQPDGEDSSDDSDSSEDDTPSGAEQKGGASLHIEKFGGCNARIVVHSAQNIQMGDHNVMVINKTRSPTRGKALPDVAPPGQAPPALTAIQQAVLDCCQVVSERQMRVVSVQIGKPWRRILRKLELPEEEIENLYQNYNSGGIQEVILQGLTLWKERKGRAATTGIMANAIFHITQNTKVLDSLT